MSVTYILFTSFRLSLLSDRASVVAHCLIFTFVVVVVSSLNEIHFYLSCLEGGVAISEYWVVTVCSSWNIVWIGITDIAASVCIRVVRYIEVMATKCGTIWWTAIDCILVIIGNRIFCLFIHREQKWLGVIFVSITSIPVGVSEAAKCVTGNCFDQGQSRALVVTQVMELGGCKAMIRVRSLVEASYLAGK